MFFLQQQNTGDRAKQEGGNGTQMVLSNADKNKSMMYRLRKDISGLDLPPEVTIEFSKTEEDSDDLQNFRVSITGTEDSYWNGATYWFTFKIPENYPYEPPVVHCQTKIWHPNIDLEGNVCLNILRKDWKPVLSINHVIFGLETLFLSPNPNDPLNKGKGLSPAIYIQLISFFPLQ